MSSPWRLFKKCKDSGQSEFLALLDWRNTPTEGIGTSPAQRLLGRRCKTLLPIAESLLKLRYDTGGDTRALAGAEQRQQHYYNRAAKPLKAITPGETVRMKLPGKDTWSPGTCTGKVADRSYVVKVGDTEYRRNRRHIQRTKEPPIPEPELPEADGQPQWSPKIESYPPGSCLAQGLCNLSKLTWSTTGNLTIRGHRTLYN